MSRRRLRPPRLSRSRARLRQQSPTRGRARQRSWQGRHGRRQGLGTLVSPGVVGALPGGCARGIWPLLGAFCGPRIEPGGGQRREGGSASCPSTRG